MKEIKAYFRQQFVDAAVKALQEAGAQDLPLLRMDAFGPLAGSDTDRHRFLRKYADKYSAMVKLELVCQDQDAERFMKVIREHSYTGQHGDGRIFNSGINEALNIRTGKTGVQAL